METVTYSNFRQNLRSYMKQMNDEAETIIVTAKDVNDTMVAMSKREYDSLQETIRILSNQYLMDKIREGDKQFEASEGIVRELIESKN